MQNENLLSWHDAVLWLRDQPERQDLVKACFFDDPIIAAATRYWLSSEWRALQNYLPRPPGNALDIGAGRGISSFAFARDGWEVVALEPDPSEVVGAKAIRQLARDAGLSISVVEDWGEDLPFQDNSFAVVHCRQVLHHARDLGRLCSEIGRVLKPGGRLVATREHVISRREDVQEFRANHPLHHLYGGENAFLLKDYTASIENGGIRLLATLNRLESDINLYPATKEDVKRRWARRFWLPHWALVPDILLGLVGKFGNCPGRLYTFVGEKG